MPESDATSGEYGACASMDPTHARDHETIGALQAEVVRHRRANLLRAVLDGYDVLDEAVTKAINAESFDRVPWLVAEQFRAENERLREAALTVGGDLLEHWAECPLPPDGGCESCHQWAKARAVLIACGQPTSDTHVEAKHSDSSPAGTDA